ncbi:MAG: U32 family peptidase [Bacilli bacterium]
MKPELLCPAGDFESLKAAILGGADAVYLGGEIFGARTFANNFTKDELIKAINYAHLYGVKIYVTVNTLIYENEVASFMDYIDFLYKNNADAVIVQDIGMIDLIRKTYPLLEIHVSTQAHIHNLDGIKLCESLGLKRAVIARETDYKTIAEIKKNTQLELEVFVHGALCISYSGQCLMSSLIGGRSGNRGSCAGSCRQKYSLFSNKKIIDTNYLLSTKDLNSLDDIGKLIDIGINSFKIEGRMKSPNYVYIVTSLYRKAIDSYLKLGKVNITADELKDLKKIFNRGFTKGFLFNDTNKNIANGFRPNHLGIEIGKVIDYKDGFMKIKLNDNLNLQDGIRIIGNPDKGCTVISMFKNRLKITNATSGDIIDIPFKDEVYKDNIVLKTTDYLLNKEIDNILKVKKRRVLINGLVEAYLDKPLKLTINDGINEIIVNGNLVSKSLNCPIEEPKIKEQISKIGDTVYEFENLKINKDENIFISIKELNDLKRHATDLLNEKRIYKLPYKKEIYKTEVPNFIKEEQYCALINDLEQYKKIKKCNLKNIYCDLDIYDTRKVLKLERVINEHKEYDEPLLVGELGSVINDCITDFSLNVVNSYSVAFLHNLGVKKVTLSYELNIDQIKELIDNYKTRYEALPNLELIVYAKEEIMISKFNLNDFYNIQDQTYLMDRFENKYPIIIKNSLMHIYNYKFRNLDNYNAYFKLGINSLRFNILDTEDLDNCLEIMKKIKLHE